MRMDLRRFGEEELAAEQYLQCQFLLDQATGSSLFRQISFFGFVLLVAAAAAVRCPLLVFVDRAHVAVNSSQQRNASLDFSFSLAGLGSNHRFASGGCALISETVQSRPIRITARCFLPRGRGFETAVTVDNRTHELNWSVGNARSSPVDLFRIARIETRSVVLSMTITTDWTEISGVEFSWRFGNAMGESYKKCAKLLLSMMVALTLVAFLRRLTPTGEGRTQIFLAIVGVSGVLASNPVMCVLRSRASARIPDALFQGIFIGVFRMCMAVELEMLRTNYHSITLLLTVILVIVFAGYAALDCTASYARQVALYSIESVGFQSDPIVIASNIVYVVLSVFHFAGAALQNDGSNRRHVAFFGSIVATTNFVTFLTQIVCPDAEKFRFSLMPSMLFFSVHMVTAAMLIYSCRAATAPPTPSSRAGPSATSAQSFGSDPSGLLLSHVRERRSKACHLRCLYSQ
jgi:hypothetical protein